MTAALTPVVKIDKLTKKYRGVTALDDLSLELAPGRIIGLVGENGCGKTTLLKILAGLLSDWSGSVSINGHSLGPTTKKDIAFLPSVDFLDPTLDARHAIELYERFFADFDAVKARQTIDYFGLPFDRQLKEMSRGMGEKLHIALVMARRAQLHLLDEPISGVDPAARDVILSGILADFDANSTLLLSTHLIADVETILDDVVMLKNGRLLVARNADDLREEYGMSLDAFFRKEYR